MSRLTIAVFTFAIAVAGLGFSLYEAFWTGFLDIRGVVQILNIFNVLLGGEAASAPPQASAHGAVTAAFLFAIVALLSFWWVVRERVRRYSGPQVCVRI
jgi:hypothetical protein